MASDRKHMIKISSSGGTATAKKYGKDYMSMLAKKSWKNRKPVGVK